MDIQEIKNIWQAYDSKLEKSFRLNMHCLELIQSQKAKSKLKPVLILRIVEIVLHIIVIGWLGNFLYKNFLQWPYALSAAALILFFVVALSNCTRQIITIMQIDYSNNVTDIQKKLTLLQAHIVDYVRLTFLVLPTWLAYPLITFKALTNIDIIPYVNHNWWIGQLIFTALIIPVCIWLYRQVSYKNLHKKWVRYIIIKSTGYSVTKAMEFINEIDEFRQ
jgi:hypothetical protein